MAVLCPFRPEEKQALLEAPDAAARRRTMIAIFEFSASSVLAPGGRAN